MSTDCVICAKHRDGPVIWADDLVVVAHYPPGDGTVMLGHLFVETRRHVPTLADLTEPEAEAVGRAARRAARALRAELDVEYVFSAIVGRQVPHFHQHLFVRHTGTPDTYAWDAGDEWSDVPKGDATEVAALSDRLRPHLLTGGA